MRFQTAALLADARTGVLLPIPAFRTNAEAGDIAAPGCQIAYDVLILPGQFLFVLPEANIGAAPPHLKATIALLTS